MKCYVIKVFHVNCSTLMCGNILTSFDRWERDANPFILSIFYTHYGKNRISLRHQPPLRYSCEKCVKGGARADGTVDGSVCDGGLSGGPRDAVSSAAYSEPAQENLDAMQKWTSGKNYFSKKRSVYRHDAMGYNVFVLFHGDLNNNK